MDTIKNIYCIGRNYAAHVHELKNKLPGSPVVFSKPTHALIKADGAAIKLPNNEGAIHYEAELVIKISQDYHTDMAVDDLVDEMTIGLDLTLRDVQKDLKEQGYPWLLSKGFPNSAILGKFIPFPGIVKCQEDDFSLMINGQTVQKGNISQMMFDLETLVHFIGVRLGLGKGDLIFTGTPSGVGPLKDGDDFILKWGEQKLGNSTIVLK